MKKSELTGINLKVRFYQADADYQFSANVSEDSLNMFVGTALNQLTKYLNVAKKCNAKVFRFTSPIGLQVEANGKIYDTGLANEKLTCKLRVQRSSKGYTRFAVRTFEVVKFAVNPIEGITLQDYLNSFAD